MVKVPISADCWHLFDSFSLSVGWSSSSILHEHKRKALSYNSACNFNSILLMVSDGCYFRVSSVPEETSSSGSLQRTGCEWRLGSVCFATKKRKIPAGLKNSHFARFQEMSWHSEIEYFVRQVFFPLIWRDGRLSVDCWSLCSFILKHHTLYFIYEVHTLRTLCSMLIECKLLILWFWYLFIFLCIFKFPRNA